jgi:hypothetical protein
MKGRFLGPSNEVANERIKLGTARWFGSLPRTEGKTVKTWVEVLATALCTERGTKTKGIKRNKPRRTNKNQNRLQQLNQTGWIQLHTGDGRNRTTDAHRNGEFQIQQNQNQKRNSKHYPKTNFSITIQIRFQLRNTDVTTLPHLIIGNENRVLSTLMLI